MDIEQLKSFFMWCTIMNGGLLAFTTLLCVLAPDLVYKLQSTFFNVKRETYDSVIYGFIAAFKLLVIVFNAVPWIALEIVS